MNCLDVLVETWALFDTLNGNGDMYLDLGDDISYDPEFSLMMETCD